MNKSNTVYITKQNNKVQNVVKKKKVLERPIKAPVWEPSQST